MNYAEFVRNVSFRFYKPNRYPKGFTALSKMLRRFSLSLEVLNTKLPEHEAVIRQRLQELLHIPRLSTFAIAALINKGVSQMSPDTCYVNIGVWHGFTFLAGMSGNPDKICIGVDNFSGFGGPREEFSLRFHQQQTSYHRFYDLDYKEYFNTHHGDQIGLYLYDGDHSYENQVQGLEIAEPFFSENCIILVDDTNRTSPRQATLDFIEKSSNQYQVLLDEVTCIPDHPTFWDGLMVLQRVNHNHY